MTLDEQISALNQIRDLYGSKITYSQFIDCRLAGLEGLVYDYIVGQLRFFTLTGKGFSAVDSSGRRIPFRATRFKWFNIEQFRFEQTTSWEEYCLTKEENDK